MIMRKTLLISLIFGGCMVGPRYQEPQTEFAPEYQEAEDTTGALVDLNSWWTQFKDPILEAIIGEAIENNNNLQVAAARVQQVRAQYNITWANQLPEVDLNGYVSHYKISETLCGSNLCPPVETLFHLGFDSSWEIDLWGRLRNLTAAAFADYQASQENLRDVYITLLAELTRAYADFRSLQQQIALTWEQIGVNRGRLDLSLVRYNAGLRSEIEPLQTKAELDALQASLPPLEAQMNQSLYAIAVLTGRQPEEIPLSWIEPMPIPQAKGKIPLGFPSDLLRRRPDIRQAERLLAAATARIGAAVALLFPTFFLNTSFGYESLHSDQWFTNQSKLWKVAPNVSWPAIDWGKTRAQIDFSKAVEREAYFNYEQTILTALEEVEDALVAYTKEEARLKSLSFQVEDLKQSRNLTQARYEAGLDSFTNLLDAQQQVLLVEQDLITSEQTLSEDLIAVYKALGGDW